MDLDKAKEILKGSIKEDDGLHNTGWYLAWSKGKDEATLDGDFTAEDLEAIAFWMRNAHLTQSCKDKLK